MGTKNSKTGNPSFLKQTFTMKPGDSFAAGTDLRLDWTINEVALYRFRVALIGKIVKSKFYFLLVEVNFKENSGFFVAKFDRKGNKNLEFFEGKNQALYSPFGPGFESLSVELVSKQEFIGKYVSELVQAFDAWESRFNIILHNSKDFCKFILKKLIAGNSIHYLQYIESS